MDIKYTDGKISDLSIWNVTQNCMAFEMNKRGGKKPEPKPEKDPKAAFTCEKCGKPLTVYNGTDGKPVSLRAHAERSKEKFGRVLCLNCINNES